MPPQGHAAQQLASPRSTAISIGNFDGVHAGHAALVRAAREAVGDDGRVIILAFDPHPLSILKPAATLGRLSRFEQRTQWLREAGADDVIPLEPTRELLSQSPQAFIADVAERYRPGFVVEGPDFRFGRDRAGDIGLLRAVERAHGFKTIVIDPVERALADQSIVGVSSTLIRWLLARGRVRDARALLGRPYEIAAPVMQGDQRGRLLGMPTMNLDHGDYLLPGDGIYAGVGALEDGREFPAAISVGTKPTFGRHARVCEAHLLDFEGPLDHYGWMLRLRFHEWLRDQITYPDVEPLIAQLHRDLVHTREVATDHTRRSHGSHGAREGRAGQSTDDADVTDETNNSALSGVPNRRSFGDWGPSSAPSVEGLVLPALIA